MGTWNIAVFQRTVKRGGGSTARVRDRLEGVPDSAERGRAGLPAEQPPAATPAAALIREDLACRVLARPARYAASRVRP